MSNDETLETWQTNLGIDAQQPPPKAAPDAPSKAGVPVSRAAISADREWKNKTVLLVDSNPRSRESRAKVMRTLGVRVDCAASAQAARTRLDAEKYNLILVDLGRDVESAESLVHEIRTRNSHQLVQFLVGRPLFAAAFLRSSNSRPRRVTAIAVSAKKLSAPTVGAFDFGQKIRDAEAKKLLNEIGAQLTRAWR